MLRARPAEVAKIKIPLLPLPEQRRVAAILDKADALRQKRREVIFKLNQLLQSVFLDMFGDPVTNPKEWETGTIGELMKSVNYGTSKKADTDIGEWPILRMGNITYSGDFDLSDLKYIDLTKSEETKHTVRRGDILFNRTNSKELVGKTAVWKLDKPMAFAGYLVRARVNQRLATPEYVSGYLNSSWGKTKLMGMCKNIVGMANINATEFKNIEIHHPPVNIQKRYAKYCESVNAKKTLIQSGLDNMNNLFASLQQRAFSGNL